MVMDRLATLPIWIYVIAFLTFSMILPPGTLDAHSCDMPKAKDLQWLPAAMLSGYDVEPCDQASKYLVFSEFMGQNYDYLSALSLPDELSDATRQRIASVCSQGSNFCHHLFSDGEATVYAYPISSLAKLMSRGRSEIVFDLKSLQSALDDIAPNNTVTAMNTGKAKASTPQSVPMELQFRRYVWNENIFLQFDQPSVVEKGFLTSAEDLKLLRYDGIINRVSLRYQIDPALLKAMISVESRYNEKAESHRGAKGLMQLMPRTAAELGVTDILDPEQNIDAGARYYKWLLKRVKGKRDLALAAYNAGLQRVWDYRGIPPFAETKAYIIKVNRYYDKYKQRPQKS
jgi:hypothetical protein